jgi:hypothetical protein
MRRMGSISAPTFSSKPRMKTTQGCEAELIKMAEMTHVAESPSISVDPPTDHRHFDLWRNQLPIAIEVKATGAMTSADVPY